MYNCPSTPNNAALSSALHEISNWLDLREVDDPFATPWSECDHAQHVAHLDRLAARPTEPHYISIMASYFRDWLSTLKLCADGSPKCEITHHMAYDERWRIVATYREDDADPKEIFVHHAAGLSGYGGSSYIDAVILRDFDTDADWDAPPEEELEDLDARHYYCQNWRADVSVIIYDIAVLIERIMHSPYGVPFGIPAGDLVKIGGGEPADGTVGFVDNQALVNTYWGSSYNIADLDNDGDVDSADQTLLSNNAGATLGWGALSLNHNRLGYAGYVFDEALAGTKWHVRYRVLESVLGRWISRDPAGYIMTPNFYAYAPSLPQSWVDPFGLFPTMLSGPLKIPATNVWNVMNPNWFAAGGGSSSRMAGMPFGLGGSRNADTPGLSPSSYGHPYAAGRHIPPILLLPIGGGSPMAMEGIGALAPLLFTPVGLGVLVTGAIIYLAIVTSDPFQDAVGSWGNNIEAYLCDLVRPKPVDVAIPIWRTADPPLPAPPQPGLCDIGLDACFANARIRAMTCCADHTAGSVMWQMCIADHLLKFDGACWGQYTFCVASGGRFFQPRMPCLSQWH
jgi:RHS repeat-associated protein